ncbi:MAG TPA: hypothetical protein VIQ54_04495 [Polyangia bacterium]
MTRAARAGIALAAACFLLGATGNVLARSKTKKHHREHKSHHQPSHKDLARGKRHLKKANALAGDANCRAAVAEYTVAYELLNDPVVLFNRAECYRRIGENEKAADDYHAFLEKVPAAPNRASIEKKLLALEAPEPAEREKPAEAPPATKPPPAKVAEAPPAPAKAPPPPPPAKVAEAPPPPPPPKAPPPPPKVAEAEPPPPPPVAPPPAAPVAKPETKPEPAVVVTAPPPRDEAAAPAGGSRPWVWIALSVLAVGVGAAGYVVFRPHEQPPPETALGNYRF